jgi:hypothetical protein
MKLDKSRRKDVGKIYGPPSVPGARYVLDGDYYDTDFNLVGSPSGAPSGASSERSAPKANVAKRRPPLVKRGDDGDAA